MYFEPLKSVKCCPKLHIKQLRNNLHYICFTLHLSVRSGWVGAGVTDEKGGPGKGGVRTPDHPSGHAYVKPAISIKCIMLKT